MTEQTNQDTESILSEVTTPDELAILKQRADMMGVSYSNNIKIDTLRARIEAKLADDELPADEDDEEEVAAAPERKMSEREELLANAMRLVRIRIANLDPKKKELPGEIFTVANEYIGTVRKYVPYGEVTDEGFHVPFCIYQMLEERRFLNIKVRNDKRTGQIHVDQGWQKEFALEILPQLTQDELNNLAQAQLAAGSISGSADAYMA